MTIQFLRAWNGFEQFQVVDTLPAAEEVRLVGLDLARQYQEGLDGESAAVIVGTPTGALIGDVGRRAANEVRTLKLTFSTTRSILAQLPNGVWVGTANLPESEGMYGSQLFLATGPLNALVVTGQLATRAANLKTSTGATITNGTLDGVWALPDNNVMFVIRSNGGPTVNKAYLYYAKNTNGTLTVGNNAGAFDNGNAVMDIGSKGGTHPTGIRALHNRSMCIAIIGGVPVLLFGDYNVNFGRTPGGLNDQVRGMRSDDLGKTWYVWLEFNGNGVSTQVRHIHGIIQDPATGYVYILCGDDPTSGIIRWDGVSAAPPANTPLPNFNNYPGWSALCRLDGLTDNFRAGDLVFIKDIAFFLTDRANNAAFWNSTAISRYGNLAYSKGRKVDMSAQRDPLIGVAIPGAGVFWFSMWDTSLPGATRGYDVWSSPDGVTVVKIGHIPDVGVAGTVGVLSNVFVSKDGQLIVSLMAGAARIVAGLNSSGGTLVFSADDLFDGVPKALA